MTFANGFMSLFLRRCWMLHSLLDCLAVSFFQVTESRTPCHPQTRGLGGHFAANMLGSQSGEDNCASRASSSVCSNNTGHVTNTMHITKHPWEKNWNPNSLQLGSLYHSTKTIMKQACLNLVLATEQATGCPLPWVLYMWIQSTGSQQFFFIYFQKNKGWWLTCAMYIAKPRVPVFTLSLHRFFSLIVPQKIQDDKHVHSIYCTFSLIGGLEMVEGIWKAGLVV